MSYQTDLDNLAELFLDVWLRTTSEPPTALTNAIERRAGHQPVVINVNNEAPRHHKGRGRPKGSKDSYQRHRRGKHS
jgi:hypothetical protein